MLNEFQARGVAAALRIVEEHMRRIEEVSVQQDYDGDLFAWKNDLPEDVKRLLAENTRTVRDAIHQVCSRFPLAKQDRSASNEAFGRLPYCWQILEDAKASRLMRYGKVDEGLEKELDPLVETIINHLLEMEAVLQRIREG
jgi:hypothetical protein